MADAGGQDSAYLTDSPGTDYLEADAGWVQLSNAEVGFLHWLSDYEFVEATSRHGPDLKDVTPAVDFLLLQGDWQDP